MKKISYPTQVEALCSTLIDANIRPIIVGGYVRDFFLNLPSKDIDIELYGVATLDEVIPHLQPYGNLNCVGKSFGVLKLTCKDFEIDFSLPRKDSKIAQGHKGFQVTTDTTLTFKEAARRRDFTMNAIGYDVQAQQFLDPFHGQKDITNTLIKAVDFKTFGEDPLRILRAVAFASRFHFHIEENLASLIQKMIKEGALEELPKERIFEEIKKLLLKSDTPSYGWKLLESLGGFQFFDEFLSLSHQEKEKILSALDAIKKLTCKLHQQEKIILMLAILTSQFSSQKQNSFLDKLTNEKNLREAIIKLTQIQFHFSFKSDYSIYKLATEIEIALFIPYLLALYPKKAMTIKELEKRSKELGVFRKTLKPFIQGRDLIEYGMKPSKEFAYILNELYEKQMRGELKTKEEAQAFVTSHYTLLNPLQEAH